MLEELRKIALSFQIEPLKSFEHTAKLETVIKVLSNINESYKSFLQIEFLKNEDFNAAYQKNEKLIDIFLGELELLIVDVKFSSFSPSVAPNLIEKQPFFTDEVNSWKKEKFDEYKEDIIKGDFDNSSYITKITKKYNETERNKIFRPLFSSIGDGNKYRINILTRDSKTEKRLVKPTPEMVKIYIPNLTKIKKMPKYKTVQTFLKVKTSDDGRIELNKKNVKEIYYLEELQHDTYPFKPDTIRYNHKIFILVKKLDCEVEYLDDNYFIRNDYLDISAWGTTRDKAEDSFAFIFNSLYENYANEKEQNLTLEATELKKKLIDMIKKIVDANEA